MPKPSPFSLLLQCHPSGADPHVREIQVDVAWTDQGELALSWLLTGDMTGLRVPPVGTSLPRDRLWAHTCCELFVLAEGGEAYREFNFSPSGQWMVFDFHAYRERAADPHVATPYVQVEAGEQMLRMDVLLPASCLPSGDCRMALSCVVERAAGGHSYWALRHPAGRPDFHHREGFALALKGCSS